MAEVKWIKIMTDIFDDEKILLIDGLPERDGIIVIWFKLLCMAGKQNNDGVFLLNDKVAYTDEMLATIFRRPIATVRLALQTFEQFGMIEVINNTITIPNWNKHQSLDSYEKKKERDRLYQQERRAAQKALVEKSSDNRLTSHDSSSDVVVSEEEKDKEEDKKEIKNNKKAAEPTFDDILSKIEDDSLRQAYYDYIKMRNLIKAPMTIRALQMLITKVKDLEPLSVDRQKQLLETAILNNWKSVYPLRDEPKSGQKSPSKTAPKRGESMELADSFMAQLMEMYEEE